MSDETSIFQHIRDGTAAVAAAAQFVHLDEAQIAPFAASLRLAGLPAPAYDTEHHFRGNPVETVAFLLTLDSVNFGSGYFPHLRKRPGKSGYFTVALALKEHWETAGPLDGPALRALRADDCAYLFGQEGIGGPVAELMALFTQALNDLGQWLGERYADDPLGSIADAGQSAARLIELVSAMPLFRDVADYHGRDVPLYKRAQLLAADLALAFAGVGPGEFRDLDQLTIFADNLVPHVLRVDGVLRYDPALLSRIDRGQLIAAGSSEEVEIRAVAVHAAERIVTHLRQAGMSITAHHLDYILWNRGQGSGYKALPRHRTRTPFY
jgi:hypothetical protein